LKLLVCGGAGFIGSAFVRRRLAAVREDEVVVLDKLTYAGNRANLADVEMDGKKAERFRFVHADIADRALTSDVVMDEDVDAVVNFAAESHVDRSILDAEAFLRTGVIGVHSLLDATRALAERRRAAGRPSPRFLQISTDEVYGPVPKGTSVETDRLSPRSPYSAAKAAGEFLVQAYATTFGIDTLITRGANTYGPYQYPEKIVSLFITNAIQDRPLPLYGDGLQRREWLYVDDHADAIAVVLDRGAAGAVYNIPGAEERTNLDLSETIVRLVGRPSSLIRRVGDRPGHDRRYAMNGSRLQALGWSPRTAMDDGLAATVSWYMANEQWWRPLLDAEWAAYYEKQYGERLAGVVEG
jgi:dTDP-glucose 4,6-dehydratase